MRTVSSLALGLMAIAALLVFTSLTTCEAQDYSNCFTVQVWAVILTLVGFVLAVIVTIVNCIRTVKRRQWAWLIGLVFCLLAPLAAAPLLDIEIGGAAYSDYNLLQDLPLCAALVLTPLVAFIYSWRSASLTAAERSSSLAAGRSSSSVVVLRTLPLVALPLMALAALMVVGANVPCEELECLGTGLVLGLGILLGLIGYVLVLIATIISCVRTGQRRQRAWSIGLVICVLALPVGVMLSFPLGGNRGLQDLQVCAGLLLTPLVVIIYSWLNPGKAAQSAVPLHAAETVEEPAPPALEAP